MRSDLAHTRTRGVGELVSHIGAGQDVAARTFWAGAHSAGGGPASGSSAEAATNALARPGRYLCGSCAVGVDRVQKSELGKHTPSGSRCPPAPPPPARN